MTTRCWRRGSTPPWPCWTPRRRSTPLLLQHQSGHVGVVNTLGLKRLGITPETKAPSGGVIGVKDGRLTGYLEENAFIFYQKQLPMPSGAELLAAYRLAQDLYLSHGITTVQEGLLAPQMVPLYRAMLGSGLLQVDLVGYGEEQSGDALRAAFPGACGAVPPALQAGGV